MHTTCLQQIFTGVYKHLQIFTNIYKYLQIFTNIYKYLQTFTNINKYLQIYTNIYNHLQILTNIYIFFINIYKYLQGRNDGSLADGDSGGFPVLPLHQDHRQLLRGCASNEHNQQMMRIGECLLGLAGLGPFGVLWSHVDQIISFGPWSSLSASGPMWLAENSLNRERQVEFWGVIDKLSKLVTISPRCRLSPTHH